MPSDRKELTRTYKETPRTMGVFAIRNTVSGRSFIGSSVDVTARLNRQRFQLDLGQHPNRELQRDWKLQGADAFAFDVLDTLKPSDQPGADPADDLAVLEAMWRDKLSASLYD
jgi:hypothetical protein